jgi:hypothetical protein
LTVESLSDSGVPRDKVHAAEGRVEDIRCLLAETDAKIAGLEADLAAAEDREQREAAVAELAPAVDQLVKAVDAFRTGGKAVVAALPAVTSRTPFSNPNFAKELGDFFTNVADTITETVTRARQQVEQLRSATRRSFARSRCRPRLHRRRRSSGPRSC